MNKHDSFKNITMKQTIEQLREQAAEDIANANAPFHDSSTRTGFERGVIKGAEWEYNRTKWSNVDDNIPDSPRIVITKDKHGDLDLFPFTDGFPGWIITWAEIPL